METAGTHLAAKRVLARMIHEHFCCNRKCWLKRDGREKRDWEELDSHVTRYSAISPRTVMNNAG